MDVDRLHRSLLARGVELNPGLPDSPAIDPAFCTRLPRLLPIVHRRFDGFESMDPGSHLGLWNIDQIRAADLGYWGRQVGPSQIAIGDF